MHHFETTTKNTRVQWYWYDDAHAVGGAAIINAHYSQCITYKHHLELADSADERLTRCRAASPTRCHPCPTRHCSAAAFNLCRRSCRVRGQRIALPAAADHGRRAVCMGKGRSGVVCEWRNKWMAPCNSAGTYRERTAAARGGQLWQGCGAAGRWEVTVRLKTGWQPTTPPPRCRMLHGEVEGRRCGVQCQPPARGAARHVPRVLRLTSVCSAGEQAGASTRRATCTSAGTRRTSHTSVHPSSAAACMCGRVGVRTRGACVGHGYGTTVVRQ